MSSDEVKGLAKEMKWLELELVLELVINERNASCKNSSRREAG